MKIINFFQSVLGLARLLIVAFTCALLLLSNTFPAFAIESYQSDPREGTTQLLEIQRKTDDIGKSAPPNLEKVQRESNRGLNEVQGDADIDKQKRPENSQGAVSVEDNLKNLLEKVTGKN